MTVADMKKWPNIVENRVHMGMFDFSVIVLVGDYAEAVKYVLWKFEDTESTVEGFDRGYPPRGQCFFRRGYVPVVWIPRRPRTRREHATFAHECLHAVWHLFDWAGLPITVDNEEVMAHALGHLVTHGLMATKGTKGDQVCCK